jgi:hypothetical protein
MIPRASTKRLLLRLGDRAEIAREEATRGLGKGLPPDQVTELVILLEAEFGVSIGLLRPEASLQRLFAPVDIGNPLTWVWAESASPSRAAQRRPLDRLEWRPSSDS